MVSLDSRSSAATRTTYSQPLLITCTRSYLVATSSVISESRDSTSDSRNVVMEENAGPPLLRPPLNPVFLPLAPELWPPTITRLR